MKTLPRSVRRKIEGLGKAGKLPSGPVVHIVYRDALDKADLDHVGAADDVER